MAAETRGSSTSLQDLRNGCWKKLQERQELETDEFGKAKRIWLLSLKRPHMRAFHFSWFGFFIAFLAWFCIQPLLPHIKKDLGLTKEDLANSGISGVAAVIIVRIAAGPFCDRYGARRTMVVLLCIGAIPVGLAAFVTNGNGLVIVRLFIGILGGVFVPCQMWTMSMFSSNVVGTANALVAGWGNLGGGVAFLLMSALYELIRLGADESSAWKITLSIPVFIVLMLALPYWFLADDCPQGPWYLRASPMINIEAVINPRIECDTPGSETGRGNLAYISGSITDIESQRSIGDYTSTSIRTISDTNHDSGIDNSIETSSNFVINRRSVSSASSNISRSWRSFHMPDDQNGAWRSHVGFRIFGILILLIQYGACFGIEISVNTILNIYLLEKFKVDGCNSSTVASSTNESSSIDQSYACSVLNPTTASLITSIFGLMNLFARLFGGLFSDIFNKRYGISGRIMTHCVAQFLAGLLMIVFGAMTTLPTAISTLIIWSLFVQITEGTTFSLVPFVWPIRVGLVAGTVAAGGNLGGICWNILWRNSLDDMQSYFTLIGIFTIVAAFLSVFLIIDRQHMLDPLCRFLTRKDKPENTYNSSERRPREIPTWHSRETLQSILTLQESNV
ncbi:unnamed protein product [Owenia fusiformis]|uniref:Major facilitator superfamily (MFS) profile domain-containing protein n=1 Tax=Owenia fusiformis TaxID=6347 RepID=A0A8S4NRE3_OWEFU|nr:unnamed protein product [Owenia fusiformis]